MAKTNSTSGSDYSQPNALRVLCADNAARLRLQQIQQQVQPSPVACVNQLDADIQLLDWSSKPPEKPCKIQRRNKPEAHLPLLIVIDPQIDLAYWLSIFPSVDVTLCEFITTVELDTTGLQIRLNKLLRTTKLLDDYSRSESLNAKIILQTVMEHSNDWMVVKSLDNRFLYASGKFCRAYEMSLDQIVGINDLELGTPPELVFGKPGADWKGYWALDKEVTDSGVPLHSEPLLLDEGLGMYESMDKIPLRDENGEVFALVVCVYRFIKKGDEIKSSEDRFDGDGKSTHLWDSKQVLSDNPALFSINKERKRAEELKFQSDKAFIAKNRFIATASHDLRQPLHALGLFVGALAPTVNKDGEILVKNINSCVSALNKLLESLLDISKLDANVVSVEMSDFKIGAVFEDLKSECVAMARDKSLNIFCSADGSVVHTDEILLRRILRNLITNAINYTEHGKISLTATVIGNKVEVVVADTGIGIPADQQELVMEEFFKVDSSPTDAQQGLGLGLSIVKRLCFILGIGLRLDSDVGVGTRVYLTIPIGVSVDAKAQLESQELQSSGLESSYKFGETTTPHRRTKLLVLDDDIKVCEAVEAMLSISGYEVIIATSPERALDLLSGSATMPDALLVDFRLTEEITGIDAIEMLSKKVGKNIPALLITGDTTGEGLNQITSSGFRHLHKPVEAGELLQMVSDIVG